MNVTELLAWTIARTDDTAIKNTTSRRIESNCDFSLMLLSLLAIAGLIISSVRVDPDVRTNDERVDIDAESTRIITTPIIRSGRVWCKVVL